MRKRRGRMGGRRDTAGGRREEGKSGEGEIDSACKTFQGQVEHE